MSHLRYLNRWDRTLQPPADTPQYKSTEARAPHAPLIQMPHSMGELTGPVFGHGDIGVDDHDLLTNHAAPDGSPVGERIMLHGQVLDEAARPVAGTLVELWQANAGGRYRHRNDGYLAPLDPNFGGFGRTITDADGSFAFRTVKPGAYPWPNGGNDWRPAHIHLSVFGEAFAQRLITQCYFEGDPLIPLCPIAGSLSDARAIDQLTAKLDLNATVPFDLIAYRFDIILRGSGATPFENRAEGN